MRCGPQVVISTRVRGLLKGAQAVELTPPSVEDSMEILMVQTAKAAAVPQGTAGFLGFLVLKQRLSVFGPKCGGGALEDGITMRR